MTTEQLSQVAEITIGYSTKVKASDRLKITSSYGAAEILRKFFEPHMEYKEVFYVLLLNRTNKVLGVSKISEGGTAGTVADPKMIFQTALKAHASQIILSHNHPSGATTPSQADIELTRRLVAGGKLLEIQIVDHIILTDDTYTSMADSGLM